MATTAPVAVVSEVSSKEDVDKRIKQIRKKLKQIEEIKSKPSTLDEGQKAKLASEAALLEELKSLTV